MICAYVCIYIYVFEVKKTPRTYGFLLDGLTAPLGTSRQEPGDGKNDPPDVPCNGEEVEQHEEQSASFTLRAQHHCVHTRRLRRFGARRAVPQQEAQEVNERHQAVAHSVEDNGSLWVTETLDVDEEGEEGEECGPQADDGAHTNEALGKFDVVGFEVHVGTGRSAVLGAQEGGAQARFGL